MTTATIVQRVWNYCNTLRDDGVSYGDYVEQLTYLLFLKMADEYSKPPHNKEISIPKKLNWESLLNKSGAELEAHYINILNELGKQKGMIGEIFFKAQNEIQDPAKLYKLIQLINDENWVILGADVKGDIYEGLLQKNAEDTKSGAGQYFTPRALIKAMVECVNPEPKKSIADPACGTGGFFLAAYDFLSDEKKFKMDKSEKQYLKFKTFSGWEIVPNTARLCLMNLYLHGIGDLNSEPPIDRADSLLKSPAKKFDYVLTNPPFGKKSSFTITKDDGTQGKESLTYERQDFWTTSSNKQLNFIQHVRSMLKADGKAALLCRTTYFLKAGRAKPLEKDFWK